MSLHPSNLVVHAITLTGSVIVGSSTGSQKEHACVRHTLYIVLEMPSMLGH